MTHVASISDDRFDAEVLAASGPVLVEFTAVWCPPCKALAPVVADVAAERAERLRVVAVDIDQAPATKVRYQVMSVPTLIIFAAGEPRVRLVGYRSKARLLEELDSALAERAPELATP